MRAYSPIAGVVGGDVASPSGLTVIRLIDVPRFNHPKRAIPRADHFVCCSLDTSQDVVMPILGRALPTPKGRGGAGGIWSPL